MTKNTRNVVRFILDSRFDDIPAKAIDVAKGAIFDCVGVALAGARRLTRFDPGGMGAQRRRLARHGVGSRVPDIGP